MDIEAHAVLDFWFGDITRDRAQGIEDTDPAVWSERIRRWFRGGPAFDQQIREKFADLHARASQTPLRGWIDTPRGLLALVILLDQFSRNLNRGTPAAFAQDETARSLTRIALDRGDDGILHWYERLFLVLPLSHSESITDQDRAVAYVEEFLVPSIPPPLAFLAELNLRQTREHRDTIARFGRFPQRNLALGRESTPEELQFLGELSR
jgi:uncharacterized protein (DUF924 family)